jgi:hypothetical protein
VAFKFFNGSFMNFELEFVEIYGKFYEQLLNFNEILWIDTNFIVKSLLQIRAVYTKLSMKFFGKIIAIKVNLD